ncbi:MAG: outer membrane lipoprotein-sorting protein [Bacteriovoracaceae bacterium]
MKLFSFGMLSLALTTTAFANGCPSKSKNADEWIKYSDDQIRGESSDGRFSLEIETPEWKRTLEIKALVNGKDHSIVFIENPPKEKGTGTLRIESQMWNYLPKLKRTVTISPSMLLTSWMGSDFTNDDLLKASSISGDYNHKFLADEKVDGETYKVIENTSKDSAKVLWPRILFYLSPTDCLPRMQKYFDNTKSLARTMKLSEVKTMDGHQLPTVWVMQSEEKKNQKTTLRYTSVDFDVKFDAKTFTQQNLTK